MHLGYGSGVPRSAVCALLLALGVGGACSSDPGVEVLSAHSVSSSTVPPSVLPSVPPSALPSVPDGLDDDLFPDLGFSGIDVEHYDLELVYDPAQQRLSGQVGIDLTLTADRHEISLDLKGPEVSTVSVDGSEVGFETDENELRVPLGATYPVGSDMRLDIEYSVRPEPSLSPVGFSSGWFATRGGSYVLNEPDGARTWLPCNDHPSDKATFRFDLTVPSGVTAVANGALVEHVSEPMSERWVWLEDDPMATYLMLVLTGDYELVEGEGPNGLPLLSAVLRSDRTALQPFLDSIDEQIVFFESHFGPFPLDRYGIAVTDSSGGMAMETQGRSLFSRDDFIGVNSSLTQEMFLSHELAHQWFGNAVTPGQWSDIWLNESFATYAHWMWLEHIGRTTVAAEAGRALSSRAPYSSADPSVDELFGFNSYEGGAVTLHALRQTLGDLVFFDILRQWVAGRSGTSVVTADFIAVAESVSGADLGAFFDEWLYADVLPMEFPR